MNAAGMPIALDVDGWRLMSLPCSSARLLGIQPKLQRFVLTTFFWFHSRFSVLHSKHRPGHLRALHDLRKMAGSSFYDLHLKALIRLGLTYLTTVLGTK